VSAHHRSYSQINSLRNCGEAYRLERIEKVTQRPSCAAVAGKVVHSATESVDWLLHAGERDPLELRRAGILTAQAEMAGEIAANAVGEYEDLGSWKRYGRQTQAKPHGEDIEWFSAVGIPECISSYIAWRLANPGLTLLDIPGFGAAIEYPFVVAVEGVQVRGYIDRVFITADGVPYLCDLKSGQKPKTDEQLGTYRHALAAVGIDVTYGGYLYGLKTGDAKLTPPLDLRHWDSAKLAALYVQGDRQIELGIFIPHPGEQCQHCSVTAHCAFVQAAI